MIRYENMKGYYNELSFWYCFYYDWYKETHKFVQKPEWIPFVWKLDPCFWAVSVEQPWSKWIWILCSFREAYKPAFLILPCMSKLSHLLEFWDHFPFWNKFNTVCVTRCSQTYWSLGEFPALSPLAVSKRRPLLGLLTTRKILKSSSGSDDLPQLETDAERVVPLSVNKKPKLRVDSKDRALIHIWMWICM